MFKAIILLIVEAVLIINVPVVGILAALPVIWQAWDWTSESLGGTTHISRKG